MRLKAGRGLNADFRFVGVLQRVHFQALFVVGVDLGHPFTISVDRFFFTDFILGVGTQPTVSLLAVAIEHLENGFVVLVLHFGVGPQWMIFHRHILDDGIHNRQTNTKIVLLCVLRRNRKRHDEQQCCN